MKIKYLLISQFLLVVLLIWGVSSIGFKIIDSSVQEIIGRENPKVQAVLEMEISSGKATKDVLSYLVHPHLGGKEKFEENIRDFNKFHEQYSRNLRTEEEKNILFEMDALFESFVRNGNNLIGLEDRQIKLITDRGILLNDKIEVILDDGLQSLIGQTGLNGCDERKERALFEMEINVHELISATRRYVLKGEPFLKERIQDSISDFERAKEIYGSEDLTTEEQELFNELKESWETVVVQTWEIISLGDIELKLVDKFEEDEVKMDNLLGVELHNIALERIKEGEERVADVTSIVLIALFLVVGISIFIAFFISKRISKPITGLRDEMEKVQKGKPFKKIFFGGTNEVRSLSDSFNNMMSALSRKTEQLERFAKVAVGREEKMIELKKKLKEKGEVK